MMNWLWFLILLVTAVLHGATGSGLTLGILQTIECRAGEQLCHYDGSCCNISEEICSYRAKTCVPAFRPGLNIKQECCEILTSSTANSTDPGIYNLCLFRYGHSMWRGACRDPPINCSPWHFWCVHSGECCISGEDVCSENDKTCKKIKLSKKSQRDMCCNALRKNDTTNSAQGILAACLFLYGNLTWQKTACGGSDGKDSTIRGLIIGLALLFILFLLLVLWQIPFVKQKGQNFFNKWQEHFSGGSNNKEEAKMHPKNDEQNKRNLEDNLDPEDENREASVKFLKVAGKVQGAAQYQENKHE